MNGLKKIIAPVAAAAIIMSHAACNNYGLLDQLENPGGGSGQGAHTLVLFASNSSYIGDIKFTYTTARVAADTECSAARQSLVFANNSCNQVRAVISLSPADSIANMPNNYGIPTNRAINAPNGFTQAPDWFTLISGTSGNALAPNVMPGGTFWWSFSNTGGNYNTSNNCLGGTDGSGSPQGYRGNSSTTGATWLADTTQACNVASKLLCICY